MTADPFARPLPRVKRTAYGKWMAVSPDTYRFRIGVIGDTKAEALCKFREAVDRWEDLARRKAEHGDLPSSGAEVMTADYVYRDCGTCGREFGVTDPDSFGPNCLADDCPSYDIDRDPTWRFAPDNPELTE